jgi:hypothetical protein
MVVNMENKAGTGPSISGKIGKPFPREYLGAPRIIVTCVRSIAARGESLTLKIMALSDPNVKSVSIRVRPLGKGAWKAIEARHIARSVWNATLPAAKEDFEYQVVAKTMSGKELIWPASAPAINQTVVVRE